MKGFEPEHQRYIHGGKQMEDDKCLSDYPGLENNSRLVLVFRLKGGRKLSLAKANMAECEVSKEWFHQECHKAFGKKKLNTIDV